MTKKLLAKCFGRRSSGLAITSIGTENVSVSSCFASFQKINKVEKMNTEDPSSQPRNIQGHLYLCADN